MINIEDIKPKTRQSKRTHPSFYQGDYILFTSQMDESLSVQCDSLWMHSTGFRALSKYGGGHFPLEYTSATPPRNIQWLDTQEFPIVAT